MKNEIKLSSINLITSLVSITGLIVLTIYVFSLPQKFVYVNTSKLINEYKGMQAAKLAYQKKASLWKANVDTLTSEVQQKILKYEKESASLSVKERQLTQELIHARQKQLMEYQKALNTQAQQENSRMIDEVVQRINTYLKKYGEEKGYKIVMAANEYGNIAYADEGLDITDEVLEGLNSEYRGN